MNPLTAALAPTRRALCTRCAKPLRSCLCAWVRPTANRVPLLVLQHPGEAGHAKGSVPLLALSLQRVQVQVGSAWPDEALHQLLQAGGPQGSTLVYPAEPGKGPPAAPASAAQPGQLVLIDGTWRQARQMVARHPLLRALPRLALPEPPPSRYGLRKALVAHHRSTLEAACLALGLVEAQPEAYLPLLDAFGGWVQQRLGDRR